MGFLYHPHHAHTRPVRQLDLYPWGSLDIHHPSLTKGASRYRQISFLSTLPHFQGSGRRRHATNKRAGRYFPKNRSPPFHCLTTYTVRCPPRWPQPCLGSRAGEKPLKCQCLQKREENRKLCLFS